MAGDFSVLIFAGGGVEAVVEGGAGDVVEGCLDASGANDRVACFNLTIFGLDVAATVR